MKTLFKVALSAGLLWFLYRSYREQFSVEPEQALPAGAKPTGQVSMATGGGPPGEDVSGFDPKAFMEVLLPTGEKIWVEIKQKLSGVFS